MTRSPQISFLSRETAELHRHIESLPIMSQLLDKDLTKTALVRALEALLLAHSPLDNTLRDILPRILPTYRTPPRAPLLISALRDLGQSSFNEGSLQFPPSASLPETLGVLYVLEGSTLGGQMIAKRLEQSSLSLSPQEYKYDMVCVSSSHVHFSYSCSILLTISNPYFFLLFLFSSVGDVVFAILWPSLLILLGCCMCGAGEGR